MASEPQEMLPPLEESDAGVQASLQQLFGTADLAAHLIPTQIIRHIVATVDNLPRKELAVQLRPLQPVPGNFLVTGSEDKQDLMLATENYARYSPVVRLLNAIEIQQAAAWYRRFYPLFQQAYENLGYPHGYFNDRLVQVIDHLLETPELRHPSPLVRPNVFYQFADPALESRSAGQKTLLRMGPDNVLLIKTRLREFRQAITQSLVTEASPPVE
ncbi:MAG: DUF3014 domain-containing protein [Steroidobacteraceae bacterium]